MVSSVLPTPVGPRNMNEPIGRFGSCRPARARRTAVETACTASVWPTTRLAELLLPCAAASRARLPASGRPECRSSARRPARCGRRSPPPRPWRPCLRCASTAFELLFELGDAAIGELAGALVVALALRLGELDARCVELGLELLRRPTASPSPPSSGWSARPTASPARRVPFQALQPVLRAGVALLLQRLPLDLELHDLAVDDCRAPRAWNRPACAAARPPRPPGRWPCRAGSGR